MFAMVNFISYPENLLPVSIIKKTSLKAPLDAAEFHVLDDKSLCIVLRNCYQRILIARKQGDVFRTWRSYDRAVLFVQTNFLAVCSIEIVLARKASGEAQPMKIEGALK